MGNPFALHATGSVVGYGECGWVLVSSSRALPKREVNVWQAERMAHTPVSEPFVGIK